MTSSTRRNAFFDVVDFAKSQWNEMYSNIRIFRWPGVEKPRKAGRDSEGTLIRWLVRRKERARAKAKPSPVFQQVVECWNCGQYGHRSFECPSRYTKDAKAMGRTGSTRIGKSKPLGRAGQMGESWVEPAAIYGWNDPWPSNFVFQPCSSSTTCCTCCRHYSEWWIRPRAHRATLATHHL